MVGLFFSRKPKAPKEDEFVFLDEKKKAQEDIEFQIEEPEDKLVRNQPKKLETVKERLERISSSSFSSTSNVRRRLETLQDSPSTAPKPFSDRFYREKVAEDKKVDLPENATIKNIEAALKKVDNIRQKMDKTNSFLSYFYDLKKAESELVAVLKEAEEQMVDLPPHLAPKIEQAKAKMRQVQ